MLNERLFFWRENRRAGLLGPIGALSAKFRLFPFKIALFLGGCDPSDSPDLPTLSKQKYLILLNSLTFTL
jgi:hypothetical protein